MHKLLTILESEHSSITSHRLGDEERWTLARVVERSRVELNELHIFGLSLGTVAHCYTVAGCNIWVCGCMVDISATSCCYNRKLRKYGQNLVGLGVEHIGSEAGQATGVAGYNLAEVVLREQIDGEVILQNRDVRMVAYLLDEGTLNLGTCQILIVEYAMLGVTSLAVKVETSILSAVEASTPANQILGRARCILHDQFNGLRVALACTADEGVLDMFLECVGGRGYRADAAL